VSAPKRLQRLVTATLLGMRWNLKRYYAAGDLHFITCSCFRFQRADRTQTHREAALHAPGSVRV